ncbi:MAG: crossover junction endodeoxyribonuclease [Ramlibacter sp.]|jgi:crossover junction endodeoxyribonuclease RuvC|nr:crossover junction endodeoxyribonuclease [Ramlibacter sp.]
MKQRLIGIDPGCSGAVVVLAPDGTVADSLLMPTLKTGKSSRVNGAALAYFLKKHGQYDLSGTHAYLEQVHAMPKQGVTSVFTFGHAAGVVEGLLQGIGIAYTLVPPQTWKKRALLIGQDKDAARSRAIQLWPTWRDLDLKGKGQALADAALIARYGSESA